MSAAVDTPNAVAPQFRTLPLASIVTSKSNPRRAMEAHALAELTDSVRKLGVLQPILVRPLPLEPNGAITYELVAGHRRFAAAEAAELAYIPATIRDLTDVEVLEIQLVENLQRADLHPLEEAEGYRRLTAVAKFDVARIAERVGRSPKYVYDRLKLLALTKEAKKLFLEDKITAGHAILLARLKPEAQARALEPDNEAVFTRESLLWDPAKDDDPDDDHHEQRLGMLSGKKTRSVKELQGWIDEHVRFDTDAGDLPDLFPETATTLAAAKEQAEKILPITHVYHVPAEAKDGNRVYGPTAWKKVGEKACDHAVTGVIVIGPGRGQAFPVCVARDKCKAHWASEQREKAKRAKARATGADGGQSSEKFKKAEEQQRLAREKQEAARKRWELAAPAVLEAFAAAITSAPAGAKDPLGQLLLNELDENRYGRSKPKAQPVPPGTTAEELVRHLAYGKLENDSHYYGSETRLPKIGKALGVDVAKIVDAAAPATPANGAKPRKRGTKAKSR